MAKTTPTLLARLDLILRRNARLPRVEPVRRLLRRPYHALLDLQRGGYELVLGGRVPVLLPAEYCSVELERYEVETVGALADWAEANEGGVFVDVGCSFGYLSCAARFLDPSGEVLAIDADLPSLEVTRRVCRYAPGGGGGVRSILGLIGDGAPSADLDRAVEQTRSALAVSGLEGAARDELATNYVCLDTSLTEDALPRYTLDDLLLNELGDRPCLIKCDVEGAEESVLRGAMGLLADARATWLISVHPPFVGRFGGSVEGIRSLLETNGYDVDVIGIDHEEHWLCTPAI